MRAPVQALLVLREARGVRIEGDSEAACNCDMQGGWESLQEMWHGRPEEQEEHGLVRGTMGEIRDGQKVAGLKPEAYEKTIFACCKARLAPHPRRSPVARRAKVVRGVAAPVAEGEAKQLAQVGSRGSSARGRTIVARCYPLLLPAAGQGPPPARPGRPLLGAPD